MKSGGEFSTCGITVAFKTLQILETLPYMCVCIYMFTTYIYIFTIYAYVYTHIYIALPRNMNFPTRRSYDLCDFFKRKFYVLKSVTSSAQFFLFHSSANYSTIIIQHF